MKAQITDQQFNEQLDFAADWVLKVLGNENEKGFGVCLMALTRDDDTEGDGIDLAMLSMPTFQMERRYEEMAAVGAHFASQRLLVLAIIFIGEVWMSNYDEMPKGGLPLPSQDPNRKEGILIAGQTHDGRTGMVNVMVERNDEQCMVVRGIQRFLYRGKSETQNELTRAFYQGYVQAGKQMMDKAGARWN